MTVLLTLNAGSSSIKFSVYRTGIEPEELTRGQVENLGPAARLKHRGETHQIGAADHGIALQAILDHADEAIGNAPVVGVGHRIVHGGTEFTRPARLNDAVMSKLRALEPLAPLHQPHNLAAIDAARAAFPDAIQIGCFDTSFHRGHPKVSDIFALPRHFYDQGVRRYGFHGLSYDFVSGELARTEPELIAGRIVIAHLGNGASMCAVGGGKSVASTMGFSALDGLCMGTRCGQLDPGVMLYLMEKEGMTTAEISTLLYKESGLKGLSGISHDMRTLEASDAPEAAEAIAYFVHRIRRELGALTATLGGLDALVFTGGIGENSATIRSGVCEGMEWLGIGIDPERNAANARNMGTGKIRVMTIPTDEERVIARATSAAIDDA